MSIVIDSVTYDIPYKVVKRKCDPLFKFAERTVDGRLHSELIGIFYNFSLTFGQSSNNVAAYAALWNKISEPVEYHEVTMPTEGVGITFDAYFSNISDEVYKQKNGVNYFRELSFSVIAVSPARTPA